MANPVIETPFRSGAFVPDGVISNQPAFIQARDRIIDTLFGKIPGQAEKLLGDPSIEPHVRVVSLFNQFPVEDKYCFVGLDSVSSILCARRIPIRNFVATLPLTADVVFAVSEGSPVHSRASAWFTSDDDAKGGDPFQLDSVTLYHRYWYQIPGTIAVPTSVSSLTPIHEFQHAISSYSNGMVVDNYVDSQVAVNNKHGRPIPNNFGSLDGVIYAAEPGRDTIGYPPGWMSYHCAYHNPNQVCVMDDYISATSPLLVENDWITRKFVLDRVRAKMKR